MKKKVISLCAFTLFIVFGIGIMDYFNLASIIGIQVDHFNLDILDISINSIVVLFLAGLTFITLDQKSITKEHNRTKTSMLMLKVSYTKCKTAINYIEDQRVNAPEIVKDEEFLNAINPFTDAEIIANLVCDGVITSEHYDKYEKIKQQYALLIFLYKKELELENQDVGVDNYRASILSTLNTYIQDIIVT